MYVRGCILFTVRVVTSTKGRKNMKKNLTANEKLFVNAMERSMRLNCIQKTHDELMAFANGFISCMNEMGVLNTSEINVIYDIAGDYWKKQRGE